MKFLPKCIFILLLTTVCLQSEERVLAFSGSTRKGSYNQQLASYAGELARKQGASVTIINLADYPMPLYQADEEGKNGMPLQAKKFRDLMISHDRIIIASPEYNGSLTALLKNSIDWASRTEDANFSNAAFKGKRFAIMSASPGQGGGKRNLAHLRFILEALGGDVVQTGVSIPVAHEAFDHNGVIKNSTLKSQLNQEIMELLR